MPPETLRQRVVGQADWLAPVPMRLLRRLRFEWRRFGSRDVIVANRRRVLESEPWTLDELRVEGRAVHARGWAFPPMGWLREERPAFSVNGTHVDDVSRESRPDVAGVFWQRLDAGTSGFQFRVTPASGPFRDGYVEVAYDNPATSLPMRLRHRWFLLDRTLEPEVPSPAQRHRVLGNDDLEGFLRTGATDFGRLQAAGEAVIGRRFREFESILDWGCGCGRVARYASRENERAFTGCDIDSDNVAWCSSHLPGRYLHTTLLPPLPFNDASFDLVYGVSVFTHLREPLQDAWLSELHRIVRRGGFVMVTVHGRTAIEFAGLPPPPSTSPCAMRWSARGSSSRAATINSPGPSIVRKST